MYNKYQIIWNITGFFTVITFIAHAPYSVTITVTAHDDSPTDPTVAVLGLQRDWR